MATEKSYTSGEEVGNAITHVIGSHLGAAMLALLIWKGVESGYDVAWKVTSGSIFGFSIILLYSISSAYHAVTYIPAKKILRIMDHMAIYFLIAGTYTPFCLVSLRADNPGLAWTIFGIEWGATVIGILFKIWTTGKFRFISTIAYIVMGWMAIVAILPLAKALQGLGTMWLAIGGASYTFGSIFYMWRSLKYAHMIWHIFVFIGTICHFFCILWYVM